MAKSNRDKVEAPKIEELISKLNEIQSGLKQNLLDFHQKISALDSEPKLLTSLEGFRRDAESKASRLEAEVKQLREQLEAVKEILGLNTKKSPVEY
jgi:hypothetical protein